MLEISSFSESFTIYDLETGQIQGFVGVPKEASASSYPGFGRYPEQLSGASQYMDVSVTPHVPKDRPEMPVAADKTVIAADGADIVTFIGVPTGTTVSTPLGKVAIDDGVLEFSASRRSQMHFRFMKFPFVEKEFIVHAV